MSSRRFQGFSIAVLGYTLAVIVWGAFVRATGSGAGCGDHWPACNGEIIPRSPSVATLIEFSHRLTSGLCLVLVVALAIWAFRIHPPGHVVRRAAFASVVYTLLEAAIGAGLVLLELVAHEASVRRALALSLHLVNTFLLLSALGTCAYHARVGDAPARGEGPASGWLRASKLALTIAGASGGVAALGDTLTQHGVRTALVELLVRLRLTHPVLAVGAVVCCAFAASAVWRELPLARTPVRWLVALTCAQLFAGILNVALQAPVWMQLLHLLLADSVWLALVITARAARSAEVASHAPAAAHAEALV
jgi:heme a synthase